MSRRSPLRTIHLLWLPLLTAATAAAMVRDWYRDPGPPTVVREHGNHEGALLQGLVALAIEFAILYAMLRPWSYRRSWARPLVASLLLGPWTLLSTMMSMHAGGVVVLHALWLWALSIILAAMFVWSVVAAAVAGVRAKRAATR
ncbi:MAG: hypothetical protein U0168_17450 [Nannocystaceae bacterium]